MKRLACLAVLCCTVALSKADHSAVAKEWVIAGLNHLREQDSIYINLTGTQTNNGKVADIRTTFLYKKEIDPNGRILEKLECVDYTGDKVTQKVVADGVNLWCYDPANNSYTTVRYGSYSATTAPANYTRNLLQGFMSAVKGRSTNIARLMLDAKAGSTVNYTPWIPTAYATVENTNPTSVQYNDGVPSKKTITYGVSPDGAGGGIFAQLSYWDNVVSGNRQKSTEWKAGFSMGLTIDSSHFSFVPPAGARGSFNSR